MGASHFYLNEDKRQYFTTGLFGDNDVSSLGRWDSARALGILLSCRGSWQHDRISVVDDSEENYSIWTSCTDIRIHVILMLIKFDGLDWVRNGIKHSPSMFEAMCGLVFHLQDTHIERLLDEEFGVGKWRRQFEIQKRGSSHDPWSQDVIRARDEKIELLRTPL